MRWLLVSLLFLACGETSDLDGTRVDIGPSIDAGRIPDMVLASIVIDGDTLIVSAGSHLKTPGGRPLDGEKVRMLGVDTPEVAHDGMPGDCWGEEAKAYTMSQIGGRTIALTTTSRTALRRVRPASRVRRARR